MLPDPRDRRLLWFIYYVQLPLPNIGVSFGDKTLKCDAEKLFPSLFRACRTVISRVAAKVDASMWEQRIRSLPLQPGF